MKRRKKKIASGTASRASTAGLLLLLSYSQYIYIYVCIYICMYMYVYICIYITHGLTQPAGARVGGRQPPIASTSPPSLFITSPIASPFPREPPPGSPPEDVPRGQAPASPPPEPRSRDSWFRRRARAQTRGDLKTCRSRQSRPVSGNLRWIGGYLSNTLNFSEVFFAL